MDNKTRMINEMAYIADETLVAEMKQNKKLMHRFNTTQPWEFEKLDEIAHSIFGSLGKNAWINPPFYCDYGKNIRVGKNCFINYNCVMLDNALITLGDNCMIAPCVSVYTAGHPLYPAARIQGYEYGLPVTLGDNVWIGGNSVICPGVNIGDNSVIGAGSVVTRDVPAWTFAAGNPCRAIRKITEEDKKYYFRRREIDAETYKAIFDKD